MATWKSASSSPTIQGPLAVTQIRIKGSKDVLERAVLASRNGIIPGFADEY
jgi:hypothetical protein